MTTTTLRPTAVARNPYGVATIGGGAGSLEAAVNDDSDSTYVQLHPGSTGDAYDWVQFAVTDYAVPANYVLKSYALKARVGPAGAGTGTQTFYLKACYGTQEFSLYDTFAVDLAGGIVNVQGPEHAPDSPGNYMLIVGPHTSIADDLNAFAVRISQPSSNELRVYEVYALITVAGPPSATVSAPSGAQSTSRPTVTWAYTMGSDGAAQSAYRVKVFTAAQYGAVGFDPVSATAVYDSGIVAGATGSIVLPDALPDGSYAAYVLVAQTINGSYQWATSYASSTFTVATTPPAVPTITVTAQASSGRIKIGLASASHDASYYEVQRSLDAMETWETIRSGAEVVMAGNGGIIYDYDLPPSTLAWYRARAIYESSTGTVAASDWSDHPSVQWTLSESGCKIAWLKCPGMPLLNTLVIVLDGTMRKVRRSARSASFPVLGRSKPIVLSDVRQARSGTLVLGVDEEATDPDTDRDRIVALLSDCDTLLLHVAPDWNLADSNGLYFAPGDVDEDRPVSDIAAEMRNYTLPFVEVDSPSGDYVGATWQDIADEFATWRVPHDTLADWAAVEGFLP